MQLQKILGRLDDAGYALFGLSYDRVPKLRDFADEFGITFPLIADFGSTWLRRLGLVNPHVADDHRRFGIEPRPNHDGLPYPGLIVTDADGIVVESVFAASYRERPSGNTLLEEVLGLAIEPEPVGEVGDGPVTVRLSADDTSWTWYARDRIHVDVDIADGWHVYVDPVPDGFTPLRVNVSGPDGLLVEPPQLPEGHPHRIEGFDETFQVVDGEVRISVPVVFALGREQGDTELEVTFELQACDDAVCMAPQTLRSTILFTRIPLV